MTNIKKNTFTAKFITPKGDRFAQDCMLYKGYVVALDKIGVGKPISKAYFNGEDYDIDEIYKSYKIGHRCYFNSFLLEKDGKLEECQQEFRANKGFLNDALFAKYSKYMFKLGENEGGYVVLNHDEEKEREKQRKLQEVAEKKEVHITNGIFGLQIQEQLPKNIWIQLKPHAKYHDGGDDDMEWADDQYPGIEAWQIRGWYYQEKIIEILQDLGWDIYYNNELLAKKS